MTLHSCVSDCLFLFSEFKVCLPGGMVSEDEDKSIAQTCLREMEEEIGIGHNQASVLGVLRCNWGEVCFV